jgi:predicted PhzF superfamily epimerase YddE/YHI9
MSLSNKFEKDPIELLLGMGGAVQYLSHVASDEANYLVSVKTKTGIRQITIPIKAVQSIQSKKPDPVVIESIKNQLADGHSFTNRATENKSLLSSFTRWLFRLFGVRQ